MNSPQSVSPNAGVAPITASDTPGESVSAAQRTPPIRFIPDTGRGFTDVGDSARRTSDSSRVGTAGGTYAQSEYSGAYSYNWNWVGLVGLLGLFGLRGMRTRQAGRIEEDDDAEADATTRARHE